MSGSLRSLTKNERMSELLIFERTAHSLIFSQKQAILSEFPALIVGDNVIPGPIVVGDNVIPGPIVVGDNVILGPIVGDNVIPGPIVVGDNIIPGPIVGDNVIPGPIVVGYDVIQLCRWTIRISARA